MGDNLDMYKQFQLPGIPTPTWGSVHSWKSFVVDAADSPSAFVEELKAKSDCQIQIRCCHTHERNTQVT